MFNLLMGLALGLVAATAVNGSVENLRLDNEIIVLAGCQMCFVLYYVFAVPLVHKCRVSRSLASSMLGFYLASQVLIVLVSTRVIFPTPWM